MANLQGNLEIKQLLKLIVEMKRAILNDQEKPNLGNYANGICQQLGRRIANNGWRMNIDRIIDYEHKENNGDDGVTDEQLEDKEMGKLMRQRDDNE